MDREPRGCGNECVSGWDGCPDLEQPLTRWQIVGMLALLLVGVIVFCFCAWLWLVADNTVAGVLVLLSSGIVGAFLFILKGLTALWAFIRLNVVGSRIYFFLTDDGVFHDHLWFPDKATMRRTTCFVRGRIGGWFRRCELTGAPNVNWELVGVWNRKMQVRDKTANRHLLWTDDPEEVLRLITRFVSIGDIVETLKRRDRALDELGIGVQYVIAWAFASKNRVRSPHAQRLREQLEEITRSLSVKGLLPEEWRVRWLDEANARLAAEMEAARTPTAPTDGKTKGDTSG